MTTADVDVGWRHLLWTVAVSCAVAALYCVTIGVLTLVRARPVPTSVTSWWLMIPGVIVFVVGFVIRMSISPPGLADRDHNTDALILIVVGVVAAVLFVSGLSVTFPGSPIEPRPDCPFPLQRFNDGAVVCVSQEQYTVVSAGEQRVLNAMLFVAYAEFARAAFARLRREF